MNTTPPSITGRMFYKQQVSCLPGEWTNSPTSFSYRWDVATAPHNPVFDGPSFLVPFIFNAWLRDQIVTCTVTATNAAGSTVAAGTARTDCRGDQGFPNVQLGRCPAQPPPLPPCQPPAGQFTCSGQVSLAYPAQIGSPPTAFIINPHKTFTVSFMTGGTSIAVKLDAKAYAEWIEIKGARRADGANERATKRVRVRVSLRPKRLKFKLKGPLGHAEKTLRVPQRVIDELGQGTKVKLRIRTTFKRPQDKQPYLSEQTAPLVLGE